MSIYGISSRAAPSWILNASPKAHVMKAWSPGRLFGGTGGIFEKKSLQGMSLGRWEGKSLKGTI